MEKHNSLLLKICEEIPLLAPLEKNGECSVENTDCRYYQKTTNYCIKKRTKPI